MALPEYFIPVLEGEEAVRFNEKADEVYQDYLKRCENHEPPSEEYLRCMRAVRTTLNNAKLYGDGNFPGI